MGGGSEASVEGVTDGQGSCDMMRNKVPCREKGEGGARTIRQGDSASAVRNYFSKKFLQNNFKALSSIHAVGGENACGFTDVYALQH
jgi:hypothetical protein